MTAIKQESIKGQDVEFINHGGGEYAVCVNGHEIDSGSIRNMEWSYKAAIKTLEAIED
ncbi:hypothetical protein [Litorimonas sp.]|uniref:hypothetical protein n=1 Tax=Litorimonas sp. TaxID=1892381 RepID=UPI003A8AE556